MERRPNVMRAINSEDFTVGGIDHAFCLAGFGFVQKYGDLYQISGTYRTLASCSNEQGRYEDALHYLSEATGVRQPASREILPLYGYHGQASSVCSHGYHFH